jgi:hypothetical protein
MLQTPRPAYYNRNRGDVKYYLRTGGVDGSFVQGNGGAVYITTTQPDICNNIPDYMP